MAANYMRSYRAIRKEVVESIKSTGIIVDAIPLVGDNLQNVESANTLFDDEKIDNIDDSFLVPELDYLSPDDDFIYYSSDDDTHLQTSEGDDDLETVSFPSSLAHWATKNQITRTAVDQLLDILRIQGHSLPKDCRTLLGTPRVIVSQDKCGGQYIYFGIEVGVLKLLAKRKNNPLKTCKLMSNIDGIPIFKSSNKQFWPILCNFDNSDVFLVALFCGESKPVPVSEFLHDFLEEIHILEKNGLNFKDEHLSFEMYCFICDAPARAFVKGTINHTGYSSCERCIEKGSWEGRVVFNSSLLYPLREEAVFQQMGYSDKHQKTKSPLIDYRLPCINTFSLDYMHLVCLGVVRRILNFLKKGPRQCRLSQGQILLISDKLTSLNGLLPSEFARQPRSLHQLDRWKATEFRQFLLYTGPIVLRNVVNKEVYNHFLTLTVAISILLCPNDIFRNQYLAYSKELLQYFVQKSKHIYGNTFISYNVHGLIHLHEDVKYFQCSLNEICAFPFENHLQFIKKLVRNSTNPIVQVAKRLNEFENVNGILYTRKKMFILLSERKFVIAGFCYIPMILFL